ncbi:hypothetical protein [Lactobacillus sp. M0390]|nr:hypothetical protein [Lactobacillus sp. M0390]
MARNKKRLQQSGEKVAKYTAIAAWAVPATALINLIQDIVKAFCK